MKNRELQTEGEPSAENWEKVTREAGFLKTDAANGDWIEVSASELLFKIGEYGKGNLNEANKDEIRVIVQTAEKAYREAKALGAVPEDRQAQIERILENLLKLLKT